MASSWGRVLPKGPGPHLGGPKDMLLDGLGKVSIFRSPPPPLPPTRANTGRTNSGENQLTLCPIGVGGHLPTAR